MRDQVAVVLICIALAGWVASVVYHTSAWGKSIASRHQSWRWRVGAVGYIAIEGALVVAAILLLVIR